jgi:apolipoprotein D and lipocalin family protein
MRAIVGITAILAALFGGCTAKYAPLQTVATVDLNKYLGVWHEIARYENRFEEGCAGAIAEYSAVGEEINILNKCLDNNGEEIKSAKGRAYVLPDSNNSKLKVTFFWPFYGDYWIRMLADGYRYSVVGEPSRKYLWILGRDRELSEDDKNYILSQLPKYGYDGNKLCWSTNSKPQREPLTAY